VPTKTGTQEKGFTLLEVMVAAVILAIVLLAIASGEATSVKTTQRSNNGSLAAASAQDIIERMQGNLTNLVGYNGFDTSNPATMPIDPTLSRDWTDWAAGMIPGGKGIVAVTPNSPIKTTLDTTTFVTVIITWTDSVSHTYTVTTVF